MLQKQMYGKLSSQLQDLGRLKIQPNFWRSQSPGFWFASAMENFSLVPFHKPWCYLEELTKGSKTHRENFRHCWMGCLFTYALSSHSNANPQRRLIPDIPLSVSL
jgi:hypothetical protein